MKVSFCLLDGEQRSCVTNWRFHILIHWSIIPSSSLEWSNGWCLNNGFLAPTYPVKPTTPSLLFTGESDTCFLQASPWCCPCPVSRLSHKLLTLRNPSSDWVVAFCLPDLFLSELPSGWVSEGNCTLWHLDFVCNFSGEKTYILIVMMVCLFYC